MSFIDLVENYIIIKEKNRDLYYDIRDNIDNHKEFIREILSYDLIVKDDFIKLEKIPAAPQKWMGISKFTTKKEYIFFLLILIFLEDKNKEDQFILSSLTDYIENNYPDEKIEWTVFKNRKSLINVMKFALDLGIIKKNDGDEEEFGKSEYGDVLYESTGISRYVVRKFNKDIYDSDNYLDLLNDAWEGISTESGIIRKNRVYRRLLLSPIIYNEGAEDSDYEYIKKYRSSIINNFEKYLEWNIHIHRNGALAVINNQNVVKDTFPSKKGECAITLLINNEIRRLLDNKELNRNESDIISLDKKEFDRIILDVRNKEGHGFTKAYRECSEGFYITSIKEFMKDYSFIRENGEKIEVMPLIGKVIGAYPKDYEDGVK